LLLWWKALSNLAASAASRRSCSSKSCHESVGPACPARTCRVCLTNWMHEPHPPLPCRSFAAAAAPSRPP
jgi:hypothetical protein